MKLNFSKNALSLMLSMLIILLSVPVIGVSAEQSDVSYVVYNTEWLRYDTAVCPANDYSIVTDSTTELTDGWWVVNDDVTLNGLDITGNAKLIIEDDCSLTINSKKMGLYSYASVNFDEGQLTVYGQADQSGYMEINCEHKDISKTEAVYGIYGERTTSENSLTLESGEIDVYSSFSYHGLEDSVKAYGVYMNNITVNGGKLCSNAYTYGYDESYSAAVLVNENFTINNGNVELYSNSNKSSYSIYLQVAAILSMNGGRLYCESNGDTDNGYAIFCNMGGEVAFSGGYSELYGNTTSATGFTDHFITMYGVGAVANGILDESTGQINKDDVIAYSSDDIVDIFSSYNTVKLIGITYIGRNYDDIHIRAVRFNTPKSYATELDDIKAEAEKYLPFVKSYRYCNSLPIDSVFYCGEAGNEYYPFLSHNTGTGLWSSGYHTDFDTYKIGNFDIDAFILGEIVTGYEIIDGTDTDAKGNISFDKKFANNGETVTISVTPDEGYSLKEITAIDDSIWNREITVTDNQFTMTNGNVTVTATFYNENLIDNFDLTEEKISIDIDETKQLSWSFDPVDCKNQNIIWESSNPSVLVVDDSGTVTGKRAGTAVVTATTESCGLTDYCTIRVKGIAPISTANIDYSNGIISGISPGLDSLDEYIELKDSSCTLEYNNLGTNSVIDLVRDKEIVDSYKIVIFGDTDGDSLYDGADSVIVNCIVNGMITQEDVDETVWIAADCNHDGVIDSLDVTLLEQAGIQLSSVAQTTS